MDNKIKAIEKKVEERWANIDVLERIMRREKELDLTEQAKITERQIDLEKARWATSYTILKFLKNELTEEDL